MFRHVWLALLLFFASFPALGAPSVTIGPGAKSSQTTIVIVTDDTSDSMAIPTDGICTARVSIAGSDVVEIWGVNPPATARTQIGSDFTASTSPNAPFTWKAGTTHVKVQGTTATTGGSTVIIDCAPATDGLSQCEQASVGASFDEYFPIGSSIASLSFDPNTGGTTGTATVTMAMCADVSGDNSCLSLNYDSNADGLTDTNILNGSTTETTGVKGITGFPYLRVEIGAAAGVGETPTVTLCRR